ncbi:hypothetical protein [Actinoallomurus iriomotensis]|uniref:Mce-associated membrane protein n=1 Tax=Actinoallomurus iriomotensis TaxID=478107 RepID=A0A9W6VQB9_9ACTN|nr:hypothetical protein [Actinoallomurus iriomotensis]GLY80933.1 hypothetical protein Airi01_092000 [Actinoallomurus iriomotensis]
MARTTAEKRPTEPDEAAEPQPEEPAPEEPTPADAASEEAEPEQAAPEETDGEEAEATEETEAGDAADEDAAKKASRRRLPRISDPVLLVAAVLVVVAGVCAGYFGWSWYGAAHDDSLAYSRDRDAVLRAAEQGVQNMNTLDYRKVEQGLASWEASTTGDLHQQLVQGSAQFSQQVRAAKTVTTAKILDAAVTELDDRAGKAGAIVAVQITVTPPTGTPATKQSRMRAQLTRTSSGWKLSALGQAPVGTTAG